MTYTEGGRAETLTLRPEEVDEVAVALARYQTAVDALHAAADEGIAVLRARRGSGRDTGAGR